MEKGAALFIVYGVYHWKTKRVAFRNDYCLVCGEARRAVQVRTFDVGHIFWIPILPAGFWKRWVCTVCGRDPHVTTKTRRGFKWAGLFILVLFAAASWIVPDDPDAVPVFWGLRIAAPVGAILTLMHASYKEGGDVERKAGYHSARGGYGVPVLRGAIVDAGFAMLVPGLRSGEERGGAKLETGKQRRENRQKHRSEDRPLQWRARALIGSQWLFLKTQLGHSPYISQCGANSYSHPNASEQDERPKRSFRKRVICRMS